VYGQRECIECTVGKFANAQTQATGCDLCVAGQHGRSNVPIDERISALKACVACPEATYSSAQGVANATDCTSCPPGKASSKRGNKKASDCIECDANTVAETSGMPECKPPADGSVVLAGGAAAVSK